MFYGPETSNEMQKMGRDFENMRFSCFQYYLKLYNNLVQKIMLY